MNKKEIDMRILLYAKKIADLEYLIASSKSELEKYKGIKEDLENRPEPIPSLHERVMELLRLHPEGLKSKEIAESLGKDDMTIKRVLVDYQPEVAFTTIPGTRGVRVWHIAENDDSEPSQWESLVSSTDE